MGIDEMEAVVAEIGVALHSLDERLVRLQAERDRALAERDAAIAARDRALQELSREK